MRDLAGSTLERVRAAARLGGPLESDRRQPGKRGPKTALSDDELVEEILTLLKATPFLGEDHRKVKAWLAAKGIRVDKNRVLRLVLVLRGRRPLHLGRRRLARREEGRPLGGAGAGSPGGADPGGFDKAIALGLGLRHDWGSQYRARQYQAEIKWLGIRSTPAYVGEPECNGVAERFIRTLKEARPVIGALIKRYNNS